MKKEILNVAASVKARLLKIAKEKGKTYDELLKLFGIERLLYRLSKSQVKSMLTLKGALFFLVWNVPNRRTTLDIDFLAKCDNSIEKISGMIKEVCLIPVENDGIIYDPKTVTAAVIKGNAEYSGVRVKLMAFIERIRIPMQIDFGFGDIIYPGAVNIKYPVLLNFPAPKLKGYPPETVISEKFEAMVKLGDLNSRMKDFYDILLIINNIKLDKKEIAIAIKRTFERRGTTIPETIKVFSNDIYDERSDRQVLWRSFLKKNGIKNVPEKLSKVANSIDRFLKKPIEMIKSGKV